MVSASGTALASSSFDDGINNSNPISPRGGPASGGIASAAARAAGRLQSRRGAGAPPLSVDVASSPSGVASPPSGASPSGASPSPHPLTRTVRPSSSPTCVFGESGSGPLSGDAVAVAAAVTRRSAAAAALQPSGSSPVSSFSSSSAAAGAAAAATRPPPASLSRVSVGAPGHFYYYSFPEAGVDLRRGSGNGGGEAAAARRPSLGAGRASRERAAAGVATTTRSASGGLPSPSPPPPSSSNVPLLLSLPPKPPSSQTAAAGATTTTTSAAAASSLPSPFASSLKPFSEDEEIEEDDDDESRAAGFLQRAPPVSRYERDAPEPPPLADRPIQWWRSNPSAAAAAAAASASDDFLLFFDEEGGAKVSSPSPPSSSKRRKTKSRSRRRRELSSHPCEVGESSSGRDLEQGRRSVPEKQGDEEEEEESDDEEEEESDEDEDLIVGKPNVRDRKLVPALTLDGRLVAAPAEQYAVLVMDVPDLPAAAERARERREGGSGKGKGKAKAKVESERVSEVIGGDGDAAGDDDGETFGTEPDPNSTHSSSSVSSSVLRAAAAGARAGGRFVKHVILGKRRLAVSAEVMAAARSRAAGEQEASRRRQRGEQQTQQQHESAGNASSDKSNAVRRKTTRTSSTEGKEGNGVEAEKASHLAVAVAAPSKPADDDGNENDADGDQKQNQQPPSPTLPFLLEDLLDDDVPIEPSIIVEETFRRLFPESFRAAVPVFRHKEVDLLLLKWDRACAALEAAEARFEAEMAWCSRLRRRRQLQQEGNSTTTAITPRRPTMRDRTSAKGRLRWLRNAFAPPKVDAIDTLARRVRELEAAISKARASALASRPTSSFFVFFDSQRDAAIAAQVNLQAEDGHSFTVVDAPGPEEVSRVEREKDREKEKGFFFFFFFRFRVFFFKFSFSFSLSLTATSFLNQTNHQVLWQTLWMPWAERDLRGLAVLPALALLLLVPIGFFLGGASQITLFLCRIDGFRIGTGTLCGSSFMRALTSILPPLLLSLWNGVILPKLLYWLALAEGRSASLSALDRRVCDVYFLFDVVNVFLGTVLGGSLFNSLRTMLQNPGSVLKTLGAAAPTVSSFWMNFLILQAVALVPSRFLFPHPGVLGDLWRAAGAGFRRFGAWARGCCGGGRKRKGRSGDGGGRRSSGGGNSSSSFPPPIHPHRSAHASMDALWPHSIRYGKEIGAALLIFVVALSYAPLSPPVPAVAAAYFLVSWLWWRFSALYVFERAYESGGRLFPHVVRAVLWVSGKRERDLGREEIEKERKREKAEEERAKKRHQKLTFSLSRPLSSNIPLRPSSSPRPWWDSSSSPAAPTRRPRCSGSGSLRSSIPSEPRCPGTGEP